MSRPHDPSAEPSRATPAAEGAAAAAPAPSPAPEAAEPAAPVAEPAAAAPERAAAPAEEKRSSGEPAAQEPEAAPAAVAVAEAEDPGAAAGTAAAAAALAEPSPGRPRASLLAAAGITGTLLIAVPFLVLGLNDDDAPADRVRTESVGGATLDPGLSGGAGTAYRAETASPSPTASASASPSTKGKSADGAGKDDKAPAADAPAAPKREEKPATEKEKKTTKKKTTKKKSAAATARSRANAASSQSRVLLKNVTTGQCADVPNYGNGKVDGPVNQYPCNGTSADNQLWDLVPHQEAGKGPGGSVLFLIRNSKDGLCLDLPNYGGVAGGTRITEYPCQATRRDNQYYWLDRRSDGTYWIRNLASRNLCLNVAGPGTGRNDAALQIGTCNDSANDDAHWYFTRK
ncbi:MULTISPECIES: RICIN domain-containing protein [unclassified Streptomyces]|uniref:RICIN domain-containing protein n=1 Tax=unclassified Streptomyces TaxID=2593676 RepID=UPI0006922991|nr:MULTISPECIES: RICIN domain-containing protein [unclassified Streptomyces]